MQMKRLLVILCIVLPLLYAAEARAGTGGEFLSTSPDAKFILYFGGTHSHTSFSDGEGLPAEAFDMARNDAHLDFWFITDHYEQLELTQATGTPKLKEWDVLRDTAKAKTENGKFVALAGYEWFDQSQGHTNVLNTDALAKLSQTYNLEKFFAWLPKHPEALMGFNHPSDQDDKRKVFYQMKYVPDAASQTVYIEVNKARDFKYYYMALDNGWRIGPVAAQDNHSKNWGVNPTGNLAAVYVYKGALTPDGIIEAFRARRFYATNERGLQLWFEGNGLPMGSELATTTVRFKANVSYKWLDKNDKTLLDKVKTKIVSNGGQTVKDQCDNYADGYGGFLICLIDFTFPVDGDGTRWFVALAGDENGKYSISAPIWVRKP